MIAEQTTPHHHRCMRCGEEFDCKSPGECQAKYDVLPSIVKAGPTGNYEVTSHCPDQPTWTWIRAYANRRAAAKVAAHIKATTADMGRL